MRIKYSLINKLNTLKSTEFTLFLYLAKYQQLNGLVQGVHNQTVCQETGMCKQSFYNALRGLEKKNIISVTKASDIDYNVLIIGNDFTAEWIMRRLMKKMVCVLIMALFVSCFVSATIGDAAGVAKVRGLKKQSAKGYYRGWKNTRAKKMSRIRYQKGYRITWKKVKKADGYEVFRYARASKQWNKIRTVKTNKVTITNLFVGESVIIKIRAYQNGSNGEKVYGSFSGTKRFKSSGYYCKYYKRGRTKYKKENRYAAEDAFLIQNQYRKKAGSQPMEWSNVLYEICCARVNDIHFKDFSHDLMDKTAIKVLNKYGKGYCTKIEDESDGGEAFVFIAGAENIASWDCEAKEVIAGWKRSQGHYKNMINTKYKFGAIATDNDGHWVAMFSRVDVDEYVKN